MTLNSILKFRASHSKRSLRLPGRCWHHNDGLVFICVALALALTPAVAHVIVQGVSLNLNPKVFQELPPPPLNPRRRWVSSSRSLIP